MNVRKCHPLHLAKALSREGEMREILLGGWHVATNLNNILKRTIIKLATEVVGLTVGKDVIVEF